jgi:MATE family multidrug resistance protein
MEGSEIGAAMATNVTYTLNLVLLEIIVYKKTAFDKTRAGFPDKRAWRNIWEYLKIGIPGACMVCFEWWCFELLAIFSGLISVEALAAEVIIVNMVSFIFMFPLGTAYAASAFTGVFLGRQKIDQAKKYAHLTLVFNLFITILIEGILWYGQNRISTLFTQDKKTVEIIETVIPVLMLYIFFDTFHGVLSGIIRGLGL